MNCEERKNILTACRNASTELASIREAQDIVLMRLYQPYFGEKKESLEKLLDAKESLMVLYIQKQTEYIEAIEKAEKILDEIHHTGARTAIRLYYICGIRTWEEVAEKCYADIRTVKRWVRRELAPICH